MSDENFNMFNQEWLNKMLNPKSKNAQIENDDKNFQNSNIQSQEAFSNFYRDWVNNQSGGSFNPEQPTEPTVLSKMSSSSSEETTQKILNLNSPENPLRNLDMDNEPFNISSNIENLPMNQLMELGKTMFSQLISQKEFQEYIIKAMMTCDDFYNDFKKQIMEQMFKHIN